MDAPTPSDEFSTRRPGRPLGSAPFRAADEALLRDAAGALVRQDVSNLTVFLRDHDVNQEKDLARLRARWRDIGDALLAEAASSATARVRTSLELVLTDVEAIAEKAEAWHSYHAFLKEVRADLRAGTTARLADTLVLLTQGRAFEHMASLPDAVVDAAGDPRRESGDPDGQKSTGDLLFLCARLLDQKALEAWDREGGLVDDHDRTAD
ncbi:hypothetical protein SAMN05660710_02957 [Paracoccus tibetensis]|uniref:Uncharacterized protein n=1 Tax=Paracoccus tibetensis TaxID=336292 RepID=A0A1G5J404_9RHOB|nr:hypothetical protein SAMN05660710_02957 [Paracoccus tibetensis]